MAHRYAVENSFSVPLPEFRNFTDGEVAALTQALAEEKRLTKSTEKGWKLTGKIADQKALQHKAWREGQVSIAKAAVTAAKADDKAMKALGSQAVKHAKHLKNANDSDNKAINQISQISGRYNQSPSGFLPWS